MIHFENVSKKFSLGTSALDDVSFQIQDNEFVFLVGPSGAGKTTILKLISRVIRPTKGIVVVNNLPVSSAQFRHLEALRRQIGFVFQDFKILPDKNVYENVALSLDILGLPQPFIKQQVYETLKLVGLIDKVRDFPVQLSAGELQRVAIARAVIGDRDIILADEPTGNLDPKTTWEIMKIFKKLEGEKTIIIATHNTDIVNSLKKRVMVMRNGKLVKDLEKGGYEV